MMSEKFQNFSSLDDVIRAAISKLEHLMQHENYHPEDKFDLRSLQSMV